MMRPCFRFTCQKDCFCNGRTLANRLCLAVLLPIDCPGVSQRELAAVARTDGERNQRFEELADNVEPSKWRKHCVEDRTPLVERRDARDLGRPCVRDVAIER